MNTYIPGIRHGSNELKALKQIYRDLAPNPGPNFKVSDEIKPLVEIVDPNDPSNLSQYTSKFEEVFVDLPRYHFDRDSKLQSGVKEVFKSYSNSISKFHKDNTSKNYIPVISGRIDSVDHSGIKSLHTTLKSGFDRICVRLFVPINKYDWGQEAEVKEIIKSMRDNDVLLADVVDVDKLSTGIRPNLEFIGDNLEDQELYLFDLFEPRDGENYNYNLVMGKYLGADGYGDFVIEPRFPSDLPPGAFQYIPNRYHQYRSADHSISTFEDSDNYLTAVNEALRTGALDKNHCKACNALYSEFQKVTSDPDRKDIGVNFMKQKRMNHYIYSVLDNEFPDLASAADADDFDSFGFDNIS